VKEMQLGGFAEVWLTGVAGQSTVGRMKMVGTARGFERVE
jgi:hypothetical protein